MKLSLDGEQGIDAFAHAGYDGVDVPVFDREPVRVGGGEFLPWYPDAVGGVTGGVDDPQPDDLACGGGQDLGPFRCFPVKRVERASGWRSAP